MQSSNVNSFKQFINPSENWTDSINILSNKINNAKIENNQLALNELSELFKTLFLTKKEDTSANALYRWVIMHPSVHTKTTKKTLSILENSLSNLELGDQEPQIKEYVRDLLVAIDDKKGPFSLVDALEEGNISALRKFIVTKSDLNVKNEDGKTPLMLAIVGKHFNILKFLLEEGADIHEKDSTGSNALMWACETKQIQMVNFLIENGADVNCINDCNRKNASFN